jgi:hypothetical protein
MLVSTLVTDLCIKKAQGIYNMKMITLWMFPDETSAAESWLEAELKAKGQRVVPNYTPPLKSEVVEDVKCSS